MTYIGLGMPVVKRHFPNGSSSLSPYTGQVATRSAMPTLLTTTTQRQLMSRCTHIARDTITSLQALFPNYYVNGGLGESGSGATATITASVEYPAGTFTQIKFSGATSGTIADNSFIVSDATTVAIPSGATFYIRCWWSSTVGILTTNNGEWIPASSDGCTFGATTTDLTMSGNVPAVGSGYFYGPLAVVATTTKPSYMLIGDSRTRGVKDTMDTSLDIGILARSVGAKRGYINTATSGGRLSGFASSNTNRKALAAYCSHALNAYGINDLANTRTAAQVVADQQTVATAIGIPMYLTTISPYTTSSDTWATTTNQTPFSWDGQRTSYNDQVRAGISGMAGFYEIANITESAQDSGRWQANGTAGKYTPDGLHESNFTNLLIQSSNAITVF